MSPQRATPVSQGPAALWPSSALLHPSTAAKPQKRRRAGRPKVRSGCVTCKRRHVKCDGAKPTCGRCAQANVECLGYQAPEAAAESRGGRKRSSARVLGTSVRTLLPRPAPSPTAPYSTLSSQSSSPSPYGLGSWSPDSTVCYFTHREAPRPVSTPVTAIMPQSPSPRSRRPSSPFSSSSSSSSSSSVLSLSPPQCSPRSSDSENDADAAYLELFFGGGLSRALAGPIPSSRFWSRTVPREMGRDGCVRSAVLAIAALATSMRRRRRVSWSPGDDPDVGSEPPPSSPSPSPSPLRPNPTRSAVRDHDHQAAIEHYMDAVSTFREGMSGCGEAAPATTYSPRSVLIATVLFVTYELLQGNNEAADGLVASGMNLLRDSLPIIRGGGGGGDGTDSDGGATRTVASPPVILLPGQELGGGMISSSSSTFHSDDRFPNENDEQEEDMHEIQHILPRLSVLCGMTAFFPRQQSEGAMALLEATSECEFPSPQPSPSVEQLTPVWSDFSTRCLMWARRQAWLGLGHVRGDGVRGDGSIAVSTSSRRSPRVNDNHDYVSALIAQAEFGAQLSRWRSILTEHQAMEEAKAARIGGEEPSCSYISSYSRSYFWLGMQQLRGSDSLISWTPEQRSQLTQEQEEHLGTMHALALMELHVVFCDTFVAGCLDPTTLTYDALGGSFAEMLALARRVLYYRQRQGHEQQQQQQKGPPPSSGSIGFTLDAGLVGPMAFVAAHCRDRALRMEAIELLHLGEESEGAYDPRVQAAGLLALVRLEEEGSGIDSDATPPLESRHVWSSGRWDAQGSRLVAQFTRVMPDPLGNAVVRDVALEL